MALRNSEEKVTRGNQIRQLGLRFISELMLRKRPRGRGGKAGWSRRGTLTHCALFPPPAAVSFEGSEYIFVVECSNTAH